MTAGIIGLGVIGASIAMALRKKFRCRVYGYDSDPETIKYALKNRIIDGTMPSHSTNYIFVAVPPASVVSVIRKLKSTNSIILHTTSIQKFVFDEFLNSGMLLFGFHPLGGAEKSGIKNANPEYILSNNSIFVVDDRYSIQPSTINMVFKMLKKISAWVVKTDPSTHDRMLSYTSHMLHLISYAIVKAPFNVNGFTGRSYSDFTRIAASDRKIWRFILKKNKENVVRSFEYVKNKVEHFIKNEFKNI